MFRCITWKYYFNLLLLGSWCNYKWWKSQKASIVYSKIELSCWLSIFPIVLFKDCVALHQHRRTSSWNNNVTYLWQIVTTCILTQVQCQILSLLHSLLPEILMWKNIFPHFCALFHKYHSNTCLLSAIYDLIWSEQQAYGLHKNPTLNI